MGYSIHIGEAKLEKVSKLDLEDSNEITARYRVVGDSLDEAPQFRGDEMTGKGSGRYPSYSSWSEFCKNNGLHDLFFNEETGLMRHHPGCFLIQQSDLDAVKTALANRKKLYPNAKPGMCNCDECSKKNFWKSDGLPHEEGYDYDLARLEWLVFWMEYALKNCDLPAISNT